MNSVFEAIFLIDLGIDFFYRFLLDLGGQLEPCWPLFRTKYGDTILAKGGFVGTVLFFDFLVALAPVQAQFWSRFWKVRASILEVCGFHFGCFWSRFGSHVLYNFGTFKSCPFFLFPLVVSKAGWWGYAKRNEFCSTSWR